MPNIPNTRHRFSRLVAVALFLGCAGLMGMAAQPPKEVEDPKAKPFKKVSGEDEDPKGTVKKKIVVDDDTGSGKKPGSAPVGNSPDVRLDELVRAAEEARTPELKALLTKYSVPFDLIKGATYTWRVRPIPIRRSEWGERKDITVEQLSGDGKLLEAQGLQVTTIRSVDHFEGMVVAEADGLLKQKSEGGAAVENMAAAEKLLAAALRFHEYARSHSYPEQKDKYPIRRGKTWDEQRDPLVAKLREVRFEMLKTAIAANDPVRIRDAGTLLMNAYPKDNAVAEAVAAARVSEAERLLASTSHADHLQAKALLDEFESRFPGAGGDAFRKARKQLKDIALKAFTRAREKKAVNDLTTARDELARAASLDPTIEGIRDMQRELRSGYPILYVGVRQYPVNMSPSTARVDSEKQAVELMFEGLLEEVPDENGSVRYRPGVALTMPTAVPSGRDFAIRTFERDSTNKSSFDTQDVVETMKMLRNRGDTWQAYTLPWLGEPIKKDNSSLRIPFVVGHPDPRATLTFKLLPARWMAENGKVIDDIGFSEAPFGTGPYRFLSNPQPSGNNPREMIFVDNTGYSRWKDHTGLPYLREVRFVEVTRIDPISKLAVPAMDPVEAFRADKLHILTDVPTGDLEKFTGPASGLNGKVQVVTSAVNRRVHILAVNLGRPHMQSKLLRQGISMAIDREEILQEVFRAGKPEFHKAMTGPYPPNSWANPRVVGGALPLVNRDLAVARLKNYMAVDGAKLDVELLYAIDDPKAEAVCQKIKSQVEGASKDAATGRKLTVNLVGVPMRELMVRVQEEHGRYDIAYMPFDYPDDWHPLALAEALDPLAVGRGGRNWFRFMSPDTNADADDSRLSLKLSQLRGHCDLVGDRDHPGLIPQAVEIGKLFDDCLPFIPLWQLDRHMIVSNNLKVFVEDTTEPCRPRLLNQTTLFQGIARWRLE